MALNQAQSRHSFSRLSSAVPMPDLLGVQVDSFSNFLQLDASEHNREDHGLHEVLANIIPIEDTHKNYILEYKSYYLATRMYPFVPTHASAFLSEYVFRGWHQERMGGHV